MTQMTREEARKALGSELFTLSQYLKDKEMATLHGERFRKMIEALTLALSDMDKVERLEAEAKMGNIPFKEAVVLKADNAKLRNEVGQLRVQLAACGVAALGYAKDKNDCKKGGYGWSASFQDVKDLWEKYAKLTERIARLSGKEVGV